MIERYFDRLQAHVSAPQMVNRWPPTTTKLAAAANHWRPMASGRFKSSTDLLS